MQVVSIKLFAVIRIACAGRSISDMAVFQLQMRSGEFSEVCWYGGGSEIWSSLPGACARDVDRGGELTKRAAGIGLLFRVPWRQELEGSRRAWPALAPPVRRGNHFQLAIWFRPRQTLPYEYCDQNTAPRLATARTCRAN